MTLLRLFECLAKLPLIPLAKLLHRSGQLSLSFILISGLLVSPLVDFSAAAHAPGPSDPMDLDDDEIHLLFGNQIKASSLKKEFKPDVSYNSVTGRHEISVSLPDSLGRSVNLFEKFDIQNQAPVIHNDGGAKTIIFHVAGAEATSIFDVKDISIEGDSSGIIPELIINNPKGIICRNATFAKNSVKLSTKQRSSAKETFLLEDSWKPISITGLGLNSTAPLSIEGFGININGSMFAGDRLELLFQHGMLKLEPKIQVSSYKDIVLEGLLIRNGAIVSAENLKCKAEFFFQRGILHASDGMDLDVSGTLFNQGSIDGLLINIAAEKLHNNCSDKTGCRIVAGVERDPSKIQVTAHENRGLNVEAKNIESNGLIHSDGDLRLRGEEKILNEGRISSEGLLVLESEKEVRNFKGEILSNSDIRISDDTSRVPLLENISGEIHAAKNLYLNADTIKNQREGINIQWSGEQWFGGCFTSHDRYHCVKQRHQNQYDAANHLPASLLADGDLIFDSEDIENDASRIWANGVIDFDSRAEPAKLQSIAHPLREYRHIYANDIVEKDIKRWECHSTGTFCGRCVMGGQSCGYTTIGTAKQSDTCNTFRDHGLSDVSFEANGRSRCVFDAAHFCEHFEAPCQQQIYSTIPALVSAAGGTKGKLRNLEISVIENEFGRMRISKELELGERVKHVRPDDQVINMIDYLRTMANEQGLYQQNLLAADSASFLATTSSGMPMLPFFEYSARFHHSPFTQMGSFALMQLDPRFSGLAIYSADAHMEHAAINAILHNRLGHGRFSAGDLFSNAVNVAIPLGFKLGERPSNELIAKLPPNTPIIWPVVAMRSEYAGVARVEPEIIFDAYTAASSVLEHGSVLEGAFIEIEVSDRAKIQGLVRATEDALRIKAKALIVQGSIESEGDIDLLGSEELFLESLADRILQSAGFKDVTASTANISAKGTVKLHGDKDLRLVGAKVRGDKVDISANGRVITVPLELYEEVKFSWNDNVAQLKLDLKKKTNLFADIISGEGGVQISGDEGIVLVGTNLDSGGDLSLRSDNGSINLRSAEGFTHTASSSHERTGFFTSESQSSSVAESYAETSKIHATGRLSLDSKHDTNILGVNLFSNSTKIEAGGDVNIRGTKSRREVKSYKEATHLFGSGSDGRFYVIGGNSDNNERYDEASKRTEVNTGDIDIRSKNKVSLEGVNLQTSGGKIKGAKGFEWKPLSEEHSTSHNSAHGGLFLDGVASTSELTFGIGLGAGSNKKNANSQGGMADRVTTTGALEFDGGNGDLDLQGVDQYGHKITKKGANIKERGAVFKFCSDEVLWSAQIGLKFGAKSKLAKAIADIVETSSQQVEIVEDGINLAFKATKNGMDLVSGILVPLEVGVWAGAQASYSQSQQCFEIATTAKTELEEFAYDADQLIRLLGVDISAQKGSFKAKNLEVEALEQKAKASQVDASVKAEIMLQGMGTPGSATASAKHMASTGRDWANSNIRVGTLNFDIEEKGAFRGVQVQAKELLATFGDLLVESLVSEQQMSGGSASLSLSPTELSSMKDAFLGAGASSQNSNKKWVNQITGLFGTERASIVVRETLHLIGGVIANAEIGEDGKLTDKGNLELSAVRLIVEDIVQADHNLGLGLDISKGLHKANPVTASGTFAYTNKHGTARATLGHGNIKIDENPEVLDQVNRDVRAAHEDLQGTDIKPIHFYVPIVDRQSLDAFYSELYEISINPAMHLQRTFDRNMKGMTWFVNPKDWTPEQDTRLRQLLEHFKVVGEEAAAQGDQETREAAETAIDALVNSNEAAAQADSLEHEAEKQLDPEVKKSVNKIAKSRRNAADRYAKRAKTFEENIAQKHTFAQSGRKSFDDEAQDLLSAVFSNGGDDKGNPLLPQVRDLVNEALDKADKGEISEAYTYADAARELSEALSGSEFDRQALKALQRSGAPVNFGAIATARSLSSITKLLAKKEFREFAVAWVKERLGFDNPTQFDSSAQNIASARKLSDQLRQESAHSPFTEDGKLKEDVLADSIIIIRADLLKNPAIPCGFAKYSTDTFHSRSGDFQVHFYKNPETGELFYGSDYKAVFNRPLGQRGNHENQMR